MISLPKSNKGFFQNVKIPVIKPVVNVETSSPNYTDNYYSKGGNLGPVGDVLLKVGEPLAEEAITQIGRLISDRQELNRKRKEQKIEKERHKAEDAIIKQKAIDKSFRNMQENYRKIFFPTADEMHIRQAKQAYEEKQRKMMMTGSNIPFMMPNKNRQFFMNMPKNQMMMMKQQGGIIPIAISSLATTDNLIKLGKVILPIIASYLLDKGVKTIKDLSKKDQKKLENKILNIDEIQLDDILNMIQGDETTKVEKEMNDVLNKKSKNIINKIVSGSGINII